MIGEPGVVVSNYPRAVGESRKVLREVGFALAELFIAFRSATWLPTAAVPVSMFFIWVNVRVGVIAISAFFFGVVITYFTSVFAILRLSKARRWGMGKMLLWQSALLVCSIPIVGILPGAIVSRHLFEQLCEYGVHSNWRQNKEELVDAISKWEPPSHEA